MHKLNYILLITTLSIGNPSNTFCQDSLNKLSKNEDTEQSKGIDPLFKKAEIISLIANKIKETLFRSSEHDTIPLQLIIRKTQKISRCEYQIDLIYILKNQNDRYYSTPILRHYTVSFSRTRRKYIITKWEYQGLDF